MGEPGSSPMDIPNALPRENLPVPTFLSPTRYAAPSLAVSDITDTSAELEPDDSMPMPLVVRNFPSLPNRNLIPASGLEFSDEFLGDAIGGMVGPFRNIYSFAYPQGAIGNRVNVEHPIYLTSRDNQPLLPQLPGDHGAEISGLIQHDKPHGEPFHLFISERAGYRYYGTYKYSSARMGHNDMAQLSGRLKTLWAGELELRIRDLQEIWPRKPLGWWIRSEGDTALIDYDPEKVNTVQFGEVLTESNLLTRTITEDEALRLSKAEIREAFDNPDFGSKPYARLYYEYFECIGFGGAFHEWLELKNASLVEHAINSPSI